jgi:hypothetical protein
VGVIVYSRLGAAKWRIAALLATAVFSHWLLDGAVHRPELPLAGATSPKVGLGLWDNLPLALGVEAVVVVVGLYLFIPGSNLSRARSLGLTLLSLLILVFTVLGMTLAPAPPSARAMAGSSLVTTAAVCLLAFWLGRLPREGQG